MQVIILEPWNKVSYQDALKKQQELTERGCYGWILFCCPPTITLGKKAHFSDVLMPMDELKRQGVSLLPVDRGGLVTYHGPGQMIGFPVGHLEAHIGDPRGVRAFIQKVEGILVEFIKSELNKFVYPQAELAIEKKGPGVWIRKSEAETYRKLVAIGMRFSRQGISHGFALNIVPLKEAFELIVPCGEIGAKPGSMFESLEKTSQINEVIKDFKNFLEK